VTAFLLTLLVVLIIVCLVVRDQNELSLSKMRADLLSLRTEEKRMEDTRVEVEQLVRWFSETLNRASSRQRTAEQYCRELEEMLEETGIEVSVGSSDSADEKS
jgi:hypothetical protein